MTVLPSSGEVVFFCAPKTHGTTILIYRNEEHQRSIEPPCDHIRGINLLGLEIDQEEYIAVSCAACGTIKLMDFENNPQWVTVFEAPGEQPRKMFQGEDFAVMVFMCEEEGDGRGELPHGSLWELRILDAGKFKLIKKTTLRGVWNEDTPMCYIPIPQLACVYKTSDPTTIKAVSVYTDKLMWKSCWRSSTEWYNIQSISCSREHQKILITDGRPRQGQVFVLDPRDGSFLQTITLHSIEYTKELQISGDKMVVWHHDTMATNYQVSFLTAISTPVPSVLSSSVTAVPQRNLETYLLPVAAQTPTAPPHPGTPSLSSSWSSSSLSDQLPAYHGLATGPAPAASAPGLPPSYSMLSLFSAPTKSPLSSPTRITSSSSAPSLGAAAAVPRSRVRMNLKASSDHLI